MSSLANSQNTEADANIDTRSNKLERGKEEQQQQESRATTTIDSPAAPTAPSFPEGGLQAWGVVVAAWCTAFASFGTVNSFGVYETYYLQTFLHNSSPSSIAWIGSIQTFAQFSAALLAGAVTDRYGPLIVIWPFSLLLVVASMLTSLCHSYYQFILCQGILLGVSCGLIFAPALTVVGQYFFKKRPLAMSLASTGSPVGGIIYPIILNNLIPKAGFGWAQRTCGFVSLVLLALAAILICPTGMKRKNHLFLPDAFQKPKYTLQVAGLFMLILGLWTPYFYIANYGLHHHIISPRLSNYLFAIINAGSFLGRISGGYLAQSLGQFNIITLSSLIASVLIFSWTAMHSSGALIALAILFGACSGVIIALMMSTLAFTADHPSKIGTYIGQATFVVGFAALAGTPVVGTLIARYGYDAGIYFSAASLLTGALLMGGARYFYAPDKLIA